MINGFAVTENDRRAMTPAEHFRAAEDALWQASGIPVGSTAYSALSINAVAHLLVLAVRRLDPDRVTEPELRLPGGITITTRLSSKKEERYGYVIRFRDNTIRASEARWSSPEAALAAGMAYAADLMAGDDSAADDAAGEAAE